MGTKPTGLFQTFSLSSYVDDYLICENLLFCSTALEEGGIVYIRPLLDAMNFVRHFLSNPDS